MSDTPAVIVHVVVHNGASWMRRILDPLMSQTYRNFKVLFLDNASSDETADIMRNEYPDIRCLRSDDNIGIWQGNERLLKEDDSPYVLVLTDVMMDARFIERAVQAMEDQPNAGAAQAKIYRADVLPHGEVVNTDIIDTVGFTISRAHRITNLGHGEKDRGQYDNRTEVFGVEGAAPFFRRSALVKCTIDGALIDPDYRVGGIGYGDDVDLSWRMRLFGYTHILVPGMVGWHNRSTTKALAATPVVGQLARLSKRRNVALAKRRLDWSNVRFTIVKNAFASHIIRFLPWIVARELAVAGYTILFEPKLFIEAGRFVRLLPRMLRRRRLIMERAVVTPRVLRRWYTD